MLKELAYDWIKDERKLKVNDRIPNMRCFHCARTILNSSFMDAFCRECHKSMSISRDGPEYDYSYFMNGKQALDRRETLEPVPFELEEKLAAVEKQKNFMLANGKPLTKEEEYIDRLYKLGK